MTQVGTLSQGWQDYISTALDNQAENHRTAFLGKVIAVNNQATRSVTVKILNERYNDEGDNMDDALILNVPVWDFRTTSSLITMPIRVGDVGMCVVMDSNTDNFKISQTARPTEVYDNRIRNVMDSVFIPGVYPFPMMINQNQQSSTVTDYESLNIVHNVGTGAEVGISLRGDGNAEIKSPFTVKVEAKDIELTSVATMTLNTPSLNVNAANTTWTGNITHTGNYTMTGQAVFNGVLFDTHFHSGVTPGMGVSGPVAG